MTDETKTEQDSSAEEGKASEKEIGTTSEKPQTYTAEQVAKLLSDTKAASGREIARAKQEAESYSRQLKQHEAELTELQKQLDEAEDARLKDEPEAVDIVKLRRGVREAQRAIARDRQQLESDWLEKVSEVETARKQQRDLAILRVAAEKKIDVGSLVALLDENSTEKQIEERADILVAAKSATQSHVDSGATTGGFGDKELIKRYAAGEPMSPEDHQKVADIISKYT